MSKPAVFLVSGDIRTGKTTWLRHWMGILKSRGVRFSGVVSLDSTPIDDLNVAKYIQTTVQPNLHLRKLLNVDSQESIEFEIENGKEGNQPVIKVGRFIFSMNAFHQGMKWLQEGLEHHEMDWLVLDEVGKLELHRGQGFEPQLSEFFTQFKETVELRRTKGKSFPKLLVMVRNELVADFEAQHAARLPEYEVLNFYRLNEHPEFSIPELEPHFGNIKGLILGGGQSRRMGFPKYIIAYQNSLPQWKRLALVLRNIVHKTGINIPRNEKENLQNLVSQFYGVTPIEKDSQSLIADIKLPEFDSEWHEKFSWEFDSNEFENSGPIGGILSYFDSWNNTEISSLLVVAVDYPLLRDEALKELVGVHRVTKKSVFYFDDSTNIINGLIGVYTYQHLQELKQWFDDGNQSLSRFLKQKAPEIYLLTPQNWSELKSIDE